jgi:predicted transcriptional regulator
MPCHAAMIEKIMTVSPDDEVETTLQAMKKANVDRVPVIDAGGVIVGVFTLNMTLENLLPVSVAIGDGLGMDVHVGAAPGIALRLKKILPLRVGDLMERKFRTVHPEASLGEGIGLLIQTGQPVMVAEPKSGKLLGLITSQSVFDELNRLKD